MRFFDKIRSSFASFMAGRYGADQLGMTMLWTALLLSIVGGTVLYMLLVQLVYPVLA